MNYGTSLVFWCFLLASTATLSAHDAHSVATTPRDRITDYQRTLGFKRVIIWGHKLHSHTHSYIHYAFEKAFRALGIETHWLDKDDILENRDISNSLFITEGRADQHMPIRTDCWYILHNTEHERYKAVLDADRAIKLQVYTHDAREHTQSELAPYVLYHRADKIIYMPWATDLLPDEIEQNKKQVGHIPHQETACFIGSIWHEEDGGNSDAITQARSACNTLGLRFITGMKVSPDMTIALIKSASLAPAIQGAWQCEHGYIPCRIFKNISYGQLGITNNKTVHELFGERTVYNADVYQLMIDAHVRTQTITREEICELMDFVRDHHTYFNRIAHLLEFLVMGTT